MKQKICFVALFALLVHQIGIANVMGAEDSCSQNISGVFISEIGWAGSSKSTVDEWLELANSSDEEINLANWTIEGAGTGGSTLTLPETSHLAPRSVFLLANHSSENSNSALSASPNYINTAISLSNSSFHLALKNEQGCLIDEAGNGQAPFFGGTRTEGSVSMIRLEPLATGSLETSWTAAETSNGFDPDALDLGTPGTIIWSPTISPQEIGPTLIEEIPPEETEEIILTEIISETETVSNPILEETENNEMSQPNSSFIESGSASTEGSVVEEVEAGKALEAGDAVDGSEATIEADVEMDEDESAFARGELWRDEEAIIGLEVTDEIIVVETSDPESDIEKNLVAEIETPVAIIEPVEEISDVAIGETTTISETIIETKIIEIIPTTIISYSEGDLVINEFVSDPVSGEKEWVEIINSSDKIISLVDWKISESSGRTASFSDIQLSSGQLAVAEFSSNVLNNDGDEISLIDPNGKIIDHLVYGNDEVPAVSDPNSVARDVNGSFVETETPTRGLENVVTEVEATEASEATEATVESAEVEATEATVEVGAGEAGKALEAGEALEVTTALSTVRLSELYPNTDGADSTDEFIELENFGTASVNLFGLMLEDVAGNNWTFPEQTNLEAGSFLAISRTEYNFALNNSGSETVKLYASDGSLLDQIQYENAPKKFTYALEDDLWRWTINLTPNESNSFPQTVESENNGMVQQASASTNSQRTATAKSPVRVSVAEARALESNSKIILEGVVSVTPNTLGKQIFYLTDGQAGIQIYKSDGDFLELAIGDRIELSGTTSSNRGEPRVKISKDDEITILENNISLAVIESETIGEKEAGQLVKVTGLITEKSSTEFTIETAESLVGIKIKDGTNIKLTDLKPGDKITITGIVGQSEEKYYLLPRSQEDLTSEKVEEVIPLAVSTEPTGKQSANQANQKKAIVIGSLVIAAIAVYAIRKRLQPKSKQYDKISKLSLAPAR